MDDYRAEGIGWVEQNPEGSEYFKQLLGYEQIDRAEVSSTLSNLASSARRSGRSDGAQVANYLRREARHFDSIPQQQEALHQAPWEKAEEITRETKRAIPFPANLIDGVAESGGQALDRYDYVFDAQTKLCGTAGRAELEMAQFGAAGAEYGAGTCNNYMGHAFGEANRTMPGQMVTAGITPQEHGFVIIGPPNYPESVHVDAWPSRDRTVTSPDTYGINNIHEATSQLTIWADGRNLCAEARQYMGELPIFPDPPLLPITRKEARDLIRAHDISDPEAKYADNTFDITSTRREHRIHHGYPISGENLDRTLGNGFRSSPSTPGAQQLQSSSSFAAMQSPGIIAGPSTSSAFGQGAASGSRQGGAPPNYNWEQGRGTSSGGKKKGARR